MLTRSPKMVVLVYFDPEEPDMVVTHGPYTTHEEAAEHGQSLATNGDFWTTELVTPEEG